MTTTNSTKTLHRANDRGFADHGWLKSYHSFSFAGYYDPSKMHFGALRVFNDDVVAAGMGFGKHPHHDMEIISIPTYGDLKHRDSLGNETIIKAGDIQVMSAGTGVAHSEMNANNDKEVRFFQIWIMPDKQQVSPRYDQRTLPVELMKNNLVKVAGPDANEHGIWLHQDASFYMADLEAEAAVRYDIKQPGRGLYLFVIEGSVEADGETLDRRDALAITGTQLLAIRALRAGTRILLIDVPLEA